MIKRMEEGKNAEIGCCGSARWRICTPSAMSTDQSINHKLIHRNSLLISISISLLRPPRGRQKTRFGELTVHVRRSRRSRHVLEITASIRSSE